MKDQARDYFTRLGILVVLIAVLVACGKDDDYGELPTRVQLPLDTPSATVDTPVSRTPSPTSPSPTTPSSPESTEMATVASPTASDLSQMLPGIEINKDFSALAPGQTAFLYGELIIKTVAGTDQQIALMIDDQGNELEIILPPGLLETLLERPIDIAGVVVSAEESVSGRLAVLPSAVDTLSSVSGDGQPEETAAPDIEFAQPPTADPAAIAALLTPIPGAERRLDIKVSPGLTALAAFDELLPLVASNVEDLLWIALRGSPETGWLVDFWDESADLTTTYRIDAQGDVHVSSQLSLPGATFYAIDRATMNVDVDGLLDLDPLPNVTEGTLLFQLEAVDEETAVWTVFLDDAMIANYDANDTPE